MMVEELGIIESDSSPLKNALVTFTSFVLFGSLPLAIYILAYFIPGLGAKSFVLAGALTGLAAFAAYGVGYLLAGV